MNDNEMATSGVGGVGSVGGLRIRRGPKLIFLINPISNLWISGDVGACVRTCYCP